MNRISFAVFMLSCCAPAIAQPPMIVRGPGANLTTLLLQPAVSKELRLDSEQLKEIGRLAISLRQEARFRPDPRDSVAKQRKKFLAARRDRDALISKSDEKVKSLLSAKQGKRAKQLVLQFNIFAGHFDAVYKSLGVPVPELDARDELESILQTVPIVASHQTAKLHFNLVKKTVDETTPSHPGKLMMGKSFQFIEFERNPSDDYERHRLPKLED